MITLTFAYTLLIVYSKLWQTWGGGNLLHKILRFYWNRWTTLSTNNDKLRVPPGGQERNNQRVLINNHTSSALLSSWNISVRVSSLKVKAALHSPHTWCMTEWLQMTRWELRRWSAGCCWARSPRRTGPSLSNCSAQWLPQACQRLRWRPSR